ncbi:M14 family metallopeptidase [Flavobacterium kingsejongi]|uniref:Peptidase M14 n=1 Tax=Flavobacterium kingsejongi TaxID=1678728 RepID=A0A2S1LT94_9FLAO|nr:M14 metallopeptidase family protein [Flavobacterium kingsejongi]AWG26959.1 peptidase M14 [Flavobacterium kingsejongi]
MNFEKLAQQYTVASLSGRYITLDHIEPLLQEPHRKPHVKIIGHSVLEKPIYEYRIGTGKTKILMWSQMHGNEATTTKAVFDLMLFLESDEAKPILDAVTVLIIPMLNPDGASLYTRANANAVDLNRDSQDLTQPESRVLRAVFEGFMPDYCFNLHDQRTIFGVDTTGKPATVSFLAPSYNDAREINPTREAAIQLIVAMNEVLQHFIPGQIGRFDDSFNINCIGDTFQHLNVPTVLFEAGHFQEDYQRDVTRKFILISLLAGIECIYENVLVAKNLHDYFLIPQNNCVFFDMMYKNIKIKYDNKEIITNFAIQYTEKLIENNIIFEAHIKEIGNLEGFYGHFEFDAKEAIYADNSHPIPEIGQKADFYLGNKVKIVNGMPNI